jgi:hypothetical protein
MSINFARVFSVHRIICITCQLRAWQDGALPAVMAITVGRHRGLINRHWKQEIRITQICGDQNGLWRRHRGQMGRIHIVPLYLSLQPKGVRKSCVVVHGRCMIGFPRFVPVYSLDQIKITELAQPVPGSAIRE